MVKALTKFPMKNHTQLFIVGIKGALYVVKGATS